MEVAVCEAFLRKKHLVTMFFDLENAYDTVWRRDIMDTLILWEYGDDTSNFFSFIGDSFRVCVDDFFSSSALQEGGVPRGNVLSVTLLR